MRRQPPADARPAVGVRVQRDELVVVREEDVLSRRPPSSRHHGEVAERSVLVDAQVLALLLDEEAVATGRPALDFDGLRLPAVGEQGQESRREEHDHRHGAAGRARKRILSRPRGRS